MILKILIVALLFPVCFLVAYFEVACFEDEQKEKLRRFVIDVNAAEKENCESEVRGKND